MNGCMAGVYSCCTDIITSSIEQILQSHNEPLQKLLLYNYGSKRPLQPKDAFYISIIKIWHIRSRGVASFAFTRTLCAMCRSWTTSVTLIFISMDFTGRKLVICLHSKALWLSGLMSELTWHWLARVEKLFFYLSTTRRDGSVQIRLKSQRQRCASV